MSDDEIRERLALDSTAVGDMAEDWACPKREGTRRTECRYCIAEVAVNAVLPTVRAIAAEELRAAATAMRRFAERPGVPSEVAHAVIVLLVGIDARADALDPR